MMEEGLRTLLLDEPTITALVNQTKGGEHLGIYVDDAPQGSPFDYLLITNLDDSHNNTLEGGDYTGAGAMHVAEVDVDCKSPTPGGAKALATAVLAYLSDYEGAAGSQTILAVVFQDRTSGPEPPTSGEGHSVHVETLDFLIQYRP